MITIYFEASIPNNVNILLQVLKGNTDIIYMKVLSVQCHFFLRSHYTTIVVYECGNTNKHNILSWLQHADTGCGTAVLFTDYIMTVQCLSYCRGYGMLILGVALKLLFTDHNVYDCILFMVKLIQILIFDSYYS